MKNVIVTGANGFIGKTLVNALLGKGYHVVALDIRFDNALASRKAKSNQKQRISRKKCRWT